MVTTPALRRILSDKASLTDYWQGRPPQFEAIKMRLFLLERQSDTRLPDHYYRRGQELCMDGIEHLNTLLTKGLPRLGDHHLELVDTKVRSKRSAWTSWQDLLTLCPPLPLISALLWHRQFTPGTHDVMQIAEFMKTYIEPNTRHSCLPAPHYPILERLRQTKGFSDLHLHLNGVTEIDTAWQLFLQKPFAVYKELLTARRKQNQRAKVDELFEQEAFGLNRPLDIYHLLKIARVLRQLMVQALFYRSATDWDKWGLDSIIWCLRYTRHLFGTMATSTKHPMLRILEPFSGRRSTWTDTCLEASMYVLLLDRIKLHKNPCLTALFHYYLLILGFFNRLLVQQMHQKGFDQFQKITLNGFRESIEEAYEKRFFQMSGNGFCNFNLIEGRFSPKLLPKDNWLLIKRITNGWEKFAGRCRQQHLRLPQLKLVAHFIKAKDRSDGKDLSDLPNLTIRHRKLRIANCNKARALAYLLENDTLAKAYIVGADVASNELEAPPEVFAPTYRYLRRKGLRHFTFHAGEDFHHLAGGLRAIYEAVKFLGLRPGDRIGHAVAAGIDPAIWQKRVGEQLVISRGEWLDDLLFVLHLLEKYPQSPLNAKLSGIHAETDRQAQRVYKKHYSVYSMIQAWLLRRFCPMHLLYDWRDALSIATFSLDEWRRCLKEKENADADALNLLKRYHQEDCRKRYRRMMKLDIRSLLSKKDLVELQNIVLQELIKREIVLEVPLTSNVRISFYKDYSTHHLFRWLDVTHDKICTDILPITVIGSDDPGIFSTNIFNEYCHIYHQLVTHFNKPSDTARHYIKTLMENAEIYAFKGTGRVNQLSSTITPTVIKRAGRR
jgi:adenosine deaminase